MFQASEAASTTPSHVCRIPCSLQENSRAS